MKKTITFLYSALYHENEKITFLKKLFISMITILVILIGIIFCVFTAV